MKKTIGIVLILASLGLGYLGIDKYQSSGESIDIAGVEISAENQKGRTESYVYLGVALLSLVIGIRILNRKA